METSRRVLMLAYPGCQILDVTGPLQMFAGANEALGFPAYRLVIASPVAGAVATNSGMRVVADVAFANVMPMASDTVIAAGGDSGLREALASGVITGIIKDAEACGARVVSVCSGAFFLAAAGVLDGRRAATHWHAAAPLARFRPAVRVDAESIWVRDGDVWSSAGVTSGIDLALALIEADHGRAISLAVARQHVVFPIRPGGQSQFAPALAASGVRDQRLAKLAARIAESPAADWRTETLAEAAGVSARTLTRLFRRELDTSPVEFVEKVRIDRARNQLLETADQIDTIARASGFGSARRMDRAFARAIAVTPSEFRSRFKQKGDASCLTSISASLFFRI